ncbi:hypothetical protein [Chryseobacterium sp. ISL-6]|uniref:hypothetical protein n=1 Tax=Chryseobacterium sp. ISL-6 TaxID=2819143 RepID=UPI001BE65F50|nr:hypothetical protein [Chryseobacterium sp. ISL-6]MBT2623274.1 hypothetical protein [Chryseobacterium sp. ISL-6]
MPNNWSEAHWVMDYKFGFIKRGLAGELFSFFLEKTEQNILFISVFILIILYASLLFIAYRETVRSKEGIETVLFYVIFFLSQYIIFTAHLIGYLDHLIFLLTILVIWLLKSRKVLLPSVLVSISILIHEISFFLMVPICCFALIISEIDENGFSIKDILARGMVKKILIFLILPLITTFGVSIYQEILGTTDHSQIFNYLEHFQFMDKKAADSVASAYTVKFTEYFSEESPHFFQRIFVSKGSVFFGIPILFMMYLVYRRFKRINIYLLLLLAVIVLFPLCLHAIAWDTYRIWSFPFMILFLGFWILNSKITSRSDASEKMFLIEIIFAVISILFVSLVPNNLLDNEVERFSLLERLVILLPLLIIWFYYYKKAPIKIY